MFASLIKEKTISLSLLVGILLLAACAAPVPNSVSNTAPQRLPASESASKEDDEENLQNTLSEDREGFAVTNSVLAKNKITIAVLLPLTGSEAETGNALLRAAIMALFDAVDPRFILLPLDTKADPLQTRVVALQAAEAGAAVVIGPLLSENVKAAGDVLGPFSIPIISFSNDSTAAAPGRFIMGFLPETEVKRVVDFAIGKGLLNHAGLIPEGRYGQRVSTAFGSAVSEGGGTIAGIERYPPDSSAVFEPVKRLSNYDKRRKEMRDEVRFLRSLRSDITDDIARALEKREVLEGIDYDAVLLPEGGALLRTLAPLLPFYEIDPKKIQLLGTGLWSDTGLLREPPLQGAWFAAPHPASVKAFTVRYEKSFGQTPPRISSLAYDAVSLLAYLARPGDTPTASAEGEAAQAISSKLKNAVVDLGVFSTNRLTREVGFTGIDGLFRFLPDGTVERALAVLEINRRGFKVVDPAPTAFPRFGFTLKAPEGRR